MAENAAVKLEEALAILRAEDGDRAQALRLVHQAADALRRSTPAMRTRPIVARPCVGKRRRALFHVVGEEARFGTFNFLPPG